MTGKCKSLLSGPPATSVREGPIVKMRREMSYLNETQTYDLIVSLSAKIMAKELNWSEEKAAYKLKLGAMFQHILWSDSYPNSGPIGKFLAGDPKFFNRGYMYFYEMLGKAAYLSIPYGKCLKNSTILGVVEVSTYENRDYLRELVETKTDLEIDEAVEAIKAERRAARKKKFKSPTLARRMQLKGLEAAVAAFKTAFPGATVNLR